jgi:hypothetical protein
MISGDEWNDIGVVAGLIAIALMMIRNGFLKTHRVVDSLFSVGEEIQPARKRLPYTIGVAICATILTLSNYAPGIIDPLTWSAFDWMSNGCWLAGMLSCYYLVGHDIIRARTEKLLASLGEDVIEVRS